MVFKLDLWKQNRKQRWNLVGGPRIPQSDADTCWTKVIITTQCWFQALGRLQAPEWCLIFRRVWAQLVGRPVSAAALWPGPGGRCWPGTQPADRPWPAAWQQASPSSTWSEPERPGRTRCGRHAASPAGWRCGGASGRAAGGQAPPWRAAGTASAGEGPTGSLLGGGHKVTLAPGSSCFVIKAVLTSFTSWMNGTVCEIG